MRFFRTTLLLFIAMVGVLLNISFITAHHLDGIKVSDQSNDGAEQSKTVSRGDSPSQESLTEQVVGTGNAGAITGYVAQTIPEPNLYEADGEGEVIPSSDEESSRMSLKNSMLALFVVAFVALVGYLASQYYGESTKKGRAWQGPKARTRIIRAPVENYVRKIKSKKGAKPSHDLGTYIKGRKQRVDMQLKTARRSNSKISSYEDEYWQHQKESFWKRVRKAAEAPASIQQIAVKRVQQYNEKMAEIRQAKEDLYEQKAQTTRKVGVQELTDEQDNRSPVGEQTKRIEHNLIIDQLKEAHTS